MMAFWNRPMLKHLIGPADAVQTICTLHYGFAFKKFSWQNTGGGLRLGDQSEGRVVVVRDLHKIEGLCAVCLSRALTHGWQDGTDHMLTVVEQVYETRWDGVVVRREAA